MRPGALRRRIGLLHVSDGTRILGPLGLRLRLGIRKTLLSPLGNHTRRGPSHRSKFRIYSSVWRPRRIALTDLRRNRSPAISLRGLLGGPAVRVVRVIILRETVGAKRPTLVKARTFYPEGRSASAVTSEAGES
jgi:hypothetical protein